MPVVELKKVIPDKQLIAQLEDLLEDAKLGKIVEIAGSARLLDGAILCFDSGNKGGVFTMYGGLMDKAASYREIYID